MEHTVILRQESWTNKNSVLGLNSRGSTLFRGHSQNHPRTYVITKRLQAYCILQFCSRNQTAVCIQFHSAKKEQTIVLASVYHMGNYKVVERMTDLFPLSLCSIAQKCALLPVKDGFVVLPLLH